MGDQYGCKTRQDAHEYSSDQQTDQSNATGGFGERDLPAKTHKTVLPAPPALVPTSQIPLSNTQIESAIDHSIKQEFFNTISPKCRMLRDAPMTVLRGLAHEFAKKAALACL